jgi:hypothetical protein
VSPSSDGIYSPGSGNRDELCRLGPTEYVSPEDEDIIQSPKRRVLNERQAYG